MADQTGQFTEGFEVKDHALSGKNFRLIKHPELEMWMTSPVPENLEKYYRSEDYLSHSDRSRTLFEKLYQNIKFIRIKRKLRLLKKMAGETGKLLDVGTGTGTFIKAAREEGWTAFGVEPNPVARKIALEKGLEVTKELNEVSANGYDVITLWHVLEHLPNLEESVSRINSLLKPSGILVLALPNFKSWDAKHYGPYWAGYDVPRHLWHFSKPAVIALFGQNGFKMEEIRPMRMDAFYISLLSEKYRRGKMRWFSALVCGMLSNIKALRSGEYSSLIYILKKAN